MTKAVANKQSVDVSAQTLSTVLLHGDLSGLKPEEKVVYYNRVCSVVGLNPLTKPFDYLKLNGKEVLYANKGCAEQLRKVHGVSAEITKVQTIQDIYIVVVSVSTSDGRKDTASAAISIAGLRGDALANAFMKCETKAKRRATLSICSLNMLDEDEIESTSGEPAPAAPTPVIAESPKARSSSPDPSDFDYEPPVGRAAIGKEIVLTAEKLRISKQALAEWAMDDFKKPMKQLTDKEMLELLASLQKELGATNVQ